MSHLPQHQPSVGQAVAPRPRDGGSPDRAKIPMGLEKCSRVQRIPQGSPTYHDKVAVVVIAGAVQPVEVEVNDEGDDAQERKDGADDVHGLAALHLQAWRGFSWPFLPHSCG